jgi:hypothetical protein
MTATLPPQSHNPEISYINICQFTRMIKPIGQPSDKLPGFTTGVRSLVQNK